MHSKKSVPIGEGPQDTIYTVLSADNQVIMVQVTRRKYIYMGCGAESKDLILEDQRGCIRRCEEFESPG